MTFQITIDYHRKAILLSVEQIYINERFEQYRINARNGTLVIESNRPLFRARRLKHRAPNWKQIEGKPVSPHLLEHITNAIQNHLEKK